MRYSFLLATALSASSVFAAPTWPKLNLDAANPDGLEVLSDWFNMLAGKVEAGKFMGFAPICDLSKAEMSLPPKPMKTPAEGLTLEHVAVGRGTQNYTCDTSNPSSAPVAGGALATLFNASCVASTYPDLLNMMPRLAMKFDLTDAENMRMGPTDLAVSGEHYFTDLTTPFFNLDSDSLTLGQEEFSKLEETDAPANAPTGRNGEAAVKWLRLGSKRTGTGDLQEVYRVQTAGGSPPTTCDGMAATFEVQYSAQYWFYSGTTTVDS